MQAAKQGLAAMVVCSTAFVTLGRSQLKALGCPDLPIAVMPHPFGVRTRAEVRALAAVVTQATGGHGAIREVIEMILRGQGRWEAAVEVFLARSCAGHAGQ